MIKHLRALIPTILLLGYLQPHSVKRPAFDAEAVRIIEAAGNSLVCGHADIVDLRQTGRIVAERSAP